MSDPNDTLADRLEELILAVAGSIRVKSLYPEDYQQAVNELCNEMALNSGTIIAALRAQDQADSRAFKLGQRVTKKKGSNWTGCVVGFYSTSLTSIGYAVESENEKGSVQIYPETALASMGEDNQ